MFDSESSDDVLRLRAEGVLWIRNHPIEMKIDKGIENRRFARREGDGIQNKQALLNGTLHLIYAQSWRNVNIYTELRYGTATVDLNRAASRF